MTSPNVYAVAVAIAIIASPHSLPAQTGREPDANAFPRGRGFWCFDLPLPEMDPLVACFRDRRRCNGIRSEMAQTRSDVGTCFRRRDAWCYTYSDDEVTRYQCTNTQTACQIMSRNRRRSTEMTQEGARRYASVSDCAELL